MALQPLLNRRKSGKGRGFPGADQIGGAIKTVPFNRSYVENHYEVAFSAPALLSPALEDLETPVHDLEYIARQCSFTVGHLHRNDVCSSELSSQTRGNLHGHCTIHEEALLVFNGVKQAGIRATGANREDHVTLAMEGDGLTGGEIGGDHAQWDFHLLEAVTFQKTFEKGLHALAGCESHPTEAPAADIGKTHGAADPGYLLGLPAAGVSRCYDGARAYTCDAVNGDLMLFEDLQQPGVSDTAREAPTQGDTDFGLLRSDRHSQPGVLARKPAKRGNTEAANSKSSFPHRYSRPQHPLNQATQSGRPVVE
jgi:hypothetical protein